MCNRKLRKRDSFLQKVKNASLSCEAYSSRVPFIEQPLSFRNFLSYLCDNLDIGIGNFNAETKADSVQKVLKGYKYNKHYFYCDVYLNLLCFVHCVNASHLDSIRRCY